MGVSSFVARLARHAVSRDKNAWPDPCLYCQLREEEEGEIDEAEGQ